MLRSRAEVDVVDDVDVDVDVLLTVPSVVVLDVFAGSWTGTGTTVGVEESVLAALASKVPPPA
jgi:predicted nucleotidyltransferase